MRQFFRCTDIGNAERFEDHYKETVRHIPEINRWVYWDRQGWHYANIFKLTKPVALNIYKEPAECPDVGNRIELAQWAKKSESKHIQRFMLDLAAPHMETCIEEFDANPKVINCKNCIVDLETKELLPHSPTQLHLKRANAYYFPQETCPKWIKFLDEIFGGNRELIEWIKVAAGYSMLGLTTEHCFFLCYGNGRNGKGTFLEAIRYVLGSYGHTTEFDTFLQKDKSNVRLLEAVGKLKGQRFVVASETNDSTRLNEPFVKKVTGGDRLVGTVLNKSSFEFDPAHTIWFACNHLPAIKDATVAMWERVKAIPFNESFLGEQQDKYLKAALRKESNGILNWLVEGAHKYFKSGLPKDPQVCVEAAAEYRDANDKLSVFIRECLEKRNDTDVGVKEVYDRYVEWCRGANEPYPDPLKYFSENMAERGVKKLKRAAGIRFPGYQLKEGGGEDRAGYAW
jgi:putative DNA primase/helicase